MVGIMSAGKTALIKALDSLSNDVSWMKELITYLENTQIPDSDFELAGIARKISYELIKEKPNLFNNTNTDALKELTNACQEDIKVIEQPNESFDHMVKRVHNELKIEMLSVQKLTTSR